MRPKAAVAAVIALLAMAGCSSKGSTTSGTTATTVALGISTTTIPKFSGSANSKYCSVARQFSQVAVSNLSNDPRTLFREFDSLASQYLAAVPPEIRSDAETIVTAIRQLETAVKAANYDLSKVSPGSLAAVQDPKFSAAATRINAYDGQVCGLTTTST